MRIAIIHYHLRQGGVTRVIENTLAALAEKKMQTAVLAEECSGLAAKWQRHCIAVPALRYQTGRRRISPRQLKKTLRAEAVRKLGGSPDLWHVHNHHLGKNTSLTAAIASFARAGEKLLLHVHDFPEDGRAENYQTLRTDLGGEDASRLRSCLYPAGTHILYGTLNQRDYRVLSAAGLPKQQLRLLPNPAAPVETIPSKRPLPGLPFESLVLYPTRSIRRKNIGELLLWAALAPPGQGMGCTLAPDNPVAKPRYHRWVARAKQWSLPVEFELGSRRNISFQELAVAADQWITTSIAEGFGLAFLEPWTFGRPIVGRNLPAITGDFAAAGMDFSHLYDQLKIPLAWLNATAVREELTIAMRQVYERYSLIPEPSAAERAFASMTDGEFIDFGRLSEIQQERVIEKARQSPSAIQEIHPNRLASALSAAIIRRNRETVRRQFSLETYGEKLIACYQDLAETTPSRIDWVDPRKILEQFLNPSRFCLLRT